MRRSIPARAGETEGSRPVQRPAEVYPRTGGGNTTSVSDHISPTGLSPHGRGKRDRRHMRSTLIGSIPARAGETIEDKRRWTMNRVYPRTGGGNFLRLRQTRTRTGLSPHGRGKQQPYSLDRQQAGSIPARAGETISSGARPDYQGVYPRTGGGNEPA